MKNLKLLNQRHVNLECEISGGDSIFGIIKKVWKKILTIVGLIVAIWLLCPLPEISLLVGFLTGSSVHAYFNVPAWTAYVGSLIGAIIGTIVLRKLGWISKMKNFIRGLLWSNEQKKDSAMTD